MAVEEGIDDYTQDGTVDLKGNPVRRSKRGGWTACSFVVGNFTNLKFSLMFCLSLSSFPLFRDNIKSFVIIDLPSSSTSNKCLSTFDMRQDPFCSCHMEPFPCINFQDSCLYSNLEKIAR